MNGPSFSILNKCMILYWGNRSRVRVLRINTTFNNISAISWLSVLLVEETGVPRENHLPATSHNAKLNHIMLYWVNITWAGFKLTTFMKPRLSGIRTHNVHDHDTLFAKGIYKRVFLKLKRHHCTLFYLK